MAVIVLVCSPFLLMGGIPLLIGLHFYKKGKKYTSESKVMIGEIVDVVEGVKVLDNQAGWYPVIRYCDERTNSNSIYKSNTGNSFKGKYKIGNKIELRYLYTDKGIDIRTNTPMAIYGVSRHLMVVGAIITVIGIIGILLISILEFMG